MNYICASFMDFTSVVAWCSAYNHRVTDVLPYAYVDPNILHMILQKLCEKGDAEVLERILHRLLPFVDIRHDDDILLFLACRHGHMAIVKVLLRYGAQMPTDGLPLLASVFFGHKEVYKALQHTNPPRIDNELMSVALRNRDRWLWSRLEHRLTRALNANTVRRGRTDKRTMKMYIEKLFDLPPPYTFSTHEHLLNTATHLHDAEFFEILLSVVPSHDIYSSVVKEVPLSSLVTGRNMDVINTFLSLARNINYTDTLLEATYYCHTAMVETIVRRVPSGSIDYDALIRAAIAKGPSYHSVTVFAKHAKIIKFLVSSAPSLSYVDVLLTAVVHKRIEVVVTLLCEVQPEFMMLCLLRNAMESKRTLMVAIIVTGLLLKQIFQKFFTTLKLIAVAIIGVTVAALIR
jgi:hypothetical protein